jgi:2'-5' RNA ligase
MTPERLFLGVPLTEGTRESLQRALRDRSLPGRAVPPGNWHLTLRFLGSTAPEVRDRLMRRLQAADLGASFQIGFSGFGAFPRPARATVLWLGVKAGVDRLGALADTVNRAADEPGLPGGEREFKPHLTLCRIDPPRDVRPFIAGTPYVGEKMTVDRVILFRSRLGGGPARYDEVATFPLTAG